MQIGEGRLSFFLLFLMLLSIVWSMEIAGWVEGLYVVEWTALGGLVFGFLLTRTRWSRLLRHLLGLSVGVALILYVMTRYLGPELGLTGGLEVLAYHFDVWLQTVLAGQSSTDSAMFVLLMTILGWWLGYTSAWLVFGTHKVWQALALTGGAMLLVVYGSSAEVAPFFLLFIFCALLLAVRLYVYAQEQSWGKASAHYDRDIRFYFLRDGGLLVAIVIVLVWVLPLLSSSAFLTGLWAQVGGPWDAVGDQWSRLFAGVRGYRQDYENIPFGDQLALGGPLELSEDVVMWVDTEDGLYWRGAAYDRYDGRGWENTDELSVTVAAQKRLPQEGEYEMRRSVRQTISPNWSGVGQIFAAGQPLRLDLPVEATYSLAQRAGQESHDPFSTPASVSLVKSHVPLSAGQPHTVVSSISVADVGSLRGAGDDYPAWVSQRYLQLPPTLPDRVVELAQARAGDYETAYDKAIGLRDYLRHTIAYKEDVEPPPADRDAIDYLLFDSRAGYCNYYASAMVVMARSVGVPARLAVGYIGGELDSESGRYEVRERNSHAWVEVYFPRYGWVEFEPTATEEPVSRPVHRDTDLDRGGLATETELERDLDRLRGEMEDAGEGVTPSSSSEAPWLRLLLPAIAGAVAAVAVALWIARWRRAESLSGARKSYRMMCRYARLLGAGGEAHQTPYEYASLLGTRFPAAASQAERIARLYMRDRFGSPAARPPDEQEAEEAWRELRPVLRHELLRRVAGVVRGALRWRRR